MSMQCVPCLEKCMEIKTRFAGKSRYRIQDTGYILYLHLASCNLQHLQIPLLEIKCKNKIHETYSSICCILRKPLDKIEMTALFLRYLDTILFNNSFQFFINRNGKFLVFYIQVQFKTYISAEI